MKRYTRNPDIPAGYDLFIEDKLGEFCEVKDISPLIEAAKKRQKNGHDFLCSPPCDCGYNELQKALAAIDGSGEGE